MAEQFVVDAHALIWFLEANPKLGSAAQQALVDPSSRILLPAIALAEFVARGEKVALLTADANITTARIVPVIW
jgi:PIN domain nuclease of toxin-antitoxin system